MIMSFSISKSHRTEFLMNMNINLKLLYITNLKQDFYVKK